MRSRRIKTVAEMKEYIKDLPDKMPVAEIQYFDSESVWPEGTLFELKCVMDNEIVHRPSKSTAGAVKHLLIG